MECNDELHSDSSSSLPFAIANNSNGQMDVDTVLLQPVSMHNIAVKLVEEERHQEPRYQK